MSADTLRYSPNELRALIGRMFEAEFGRVADFYSSAELACWIEMRGLGAVEILASLEGQEGAGARLEDAARMLLRPDTPVNLAGAQAFPLSLALFDLAIAQAGRGTDFKRTICGTPQVGVMLGGLARSSQADLHAAAWWIDAPGDLVIASAHAGDSEAGLETFKCSGGADQNSGGVMVAQSAAATARVIECAKAASGCGALTASIPASELGERAQAALDQGVAIERDHISKLELLGSRVLVESSDLSRQGAGD